MKRDKVLAQAKEYINGQRAKDYGDAYDNFTRIADGWNLVPYTILFFTGRTRNSQWRILPSDHTYPRISQTIGVVIRFKYNGLAVMYYITDCGVGIDMLR